MLIHIQLLIIQGVLVKNFLFDQVFCQPLRESILLLYDFSKSVEYFYDVSYKITKTYLV